MVSSSCWLLCVEMKLFFSGEMRFFWFFRELNGLHEILAKLKRQKMTFEDSKILSFLLEFRPCRVSRLYGDKIVILFDKIHVIPNPESLQRTNFSVKLI